MFNWPSFFPPSTTRLPAILHYPFGQRQNVQLARRYWQNYKAVSQSRLQHLFPFRTDSSKIFSFQLYTTHELNDFVFYIQRQLCLTPCSVVTTQKAFSISVPITFPATGAGVVTPDVSQFGSLNCNNDFLVIPGGFNLGNPAGVPNMAFDRYCGERLNALPGNTASTTVCSKFQQLLLLICATI